VITHRHRRQELCRLRRGHCFAVCRRAAVRDHRRSACSACPHRCRDRAEGARSAADHRLSQRADPRLRDSRSCPRLAGDRGQPAAAARGTGRAPCRARIRLLRTAFALPLRAATKSACQRVKRPIYALSHLTSYAWQLRCRRRPNSAASKTETRRTQRKARGLIKPGAYPIRSSLHRYRARGSTFRSHEMEILGLPIASATASMSPRSQRRLPSDTARRHAAPEVIGSLNPMMDKWLGYPGRLYNRR